jgi:hypothetical protein
VRREKNRLNGFSWARSWFTALKRGVNEMISTEQFQLNDVRFAGESGGQPPQSRRCAPHDNPRQSRSVWTAVALAPL